MYHVLIGPDKREFIMYSSEIVALKPQFESLSCYFFYLYIDCDAFLNYF